VLKLWLDETTANAKSAEYKLAFANHYNYSWDEIKIRAHYEHCSALKYLCDALASDTAPRHSMITTLQTTIDSFVDGKNIRDRIRTALTPALVVAASTVLENDNLFGDTCRRWFETILKKACQNGHGLFESTLNVILSLPWTIATDEAYAHALVGGPSISRQEIHTRLSHERK
jgi:hypothetical protein